jgi:hypothetical protein
MARMLSSVAKFLAGKRLAAGVSRSPAQAANAVYRKPRSLRCSLNRNANEVESARCYPDPGSVL